jgi:hypothetical protein
LYLDHGAMPTRRLRIWLTLILIVLSIPLPSRVVSDIGISESGRIDAVSYRTEWHPARWPGEPKISHGDDALSVITSEQYAAEARRTNLPRFAAVLVLVLAGAWSAIRRSASSDAGLPVAA